MSDYYNPQELFFIEELGSTVLDFSAATGLKDWDGFEKCILAVRGDDKVLLVYGIDLTGISGKENRLQFIIKELKNKFTTEA